MRKLVTVLVVGIVLVVGAGVTWWLMLEPSPPNLMQDAPPGAQAAIANGGFESGTEGDAEDWVEATYAPSDFAAQGDTDVGTRSPDGKGCSQAPHDEGGGFRTFAGRTTLANFRGSASVELHASVDCDGGSYGQYRWRASAEIADVAIPSDAFVTFWVRMAGGVTCSPATTEDCFAFNCRGGNYDAQNFLGLLFDDGTGYATARARVSVEYHGTEPAFCNAHVTESSVDGSHHAFFDTPDESDTGADGHVWYRYTVPVPAAYLGRTARIGIVVDHFQNWASTGGTGVYVDEVCLSDARGNCL